ncbi:MAG TPA: DinB family protein [Mycobacterium sp.]|uniref:DinB family protein n=1 Tax=Mycobacterium sp. TaxID=1785 RepID=UPI002F4032ED
MAASRSDNHADCEQLPPLAAEDHTCLDCALAYSEISIEDAVSVIVDLPSAVREAVSAIAAEAHRVRRDQQVWSVAEYLCHLRDVYIVFTVRLHRVRTEDRPAMEPMFNDLRARRFRYNDCDLGATLNELAAAAAGFREQVARTGERDWDQVATRLPGEQRTARWLVRQAMHEGVHHLADIRRVGGISGRRPGIWL